MDNALKERLLRLADALESGQYKKSRYVYKDTDTCFCALGVLLEIESPEDWIELGERDLVSYGHKRLLPGLYASPLLARGLDAEIMHMNDSLDWSFEKIAKAIRKYCEKDGQYPLESFNE